MKGVLTVAGGASLLLGVVFMGLYRDQIENERSEASLRLNQMLQVTWENAMLKRDVPGLRDIVGRLGLLPGIRDVLILAPDGEVRFASDMAKLGQRLPAVASATTVGKPVSRFEQLPGGEVLRSINPVPNREACTPCHGPVVGHPVNGVLVVDYDAAPIRRGALHGAALFMGAGILVLCLTVLTLWHLLRRHVLIPLAGLEGATRDLANGDLKVRAPVVWDDEIGRTASGFNTMAGRLEQQIDLVWAQKRYLQDLLDGLPDGVRVIRMPDLVVVSANRAYLQQLGTTAAVGHPCHVSSHGRESPCPATLTLCPAAELKAPGDTLKCQHLHRRADGQEFPVEVHARLVEVDDRNGPVRYVVESIRDLAQAARLSHEQRLSELGLLAAGIAHEIHNPLGSLRLGVEGLLRQVRGGKGDEGRVTSYLEMMDGEIDRCIGVTRRLLLLSRPPELQPQPVDVNLSLSDTVMLLEFDAQSRGIVQVCELDPAAPRVMADDSDLRMVVLNLVQNAHHAMPQGGRLAVRTRGEEDSVLVEISDTGVGIPPEDLQRIFDPFFSRRADREAGTGLGLTICKGIVERYGGTIGVTSRPGEGTTFRIRLARVLP